MWKIPAPNRALLAITSFVVCLCAPIALAGDRRDVAERPPNIVFILGDDHGYPYAGFMGDPLVHTPNLDRLASEGTTFTHAHTTASVCQPAMRTLLSGLHPEQWPGQRLAHFFASGVLRPPGEQVRDMVTLPRQLARQGYESFQAGKYWEGTFEMAGYDAGMATHRDPSIRPNVGADFGRPSIDAMADFLDQRDPERPFFMQLAPMLPHTPHDPGPEFVLPYIFRGLSSAAIFYYANITRMDEVIGRIIEALETRGLREDTLVVYVSDNGWEQAPDRTHFLGIVLGGGRGKASIHEVGFRTPIIFNWPGQIERGVRFDDLVDFFDLHATLLDYAGAPIPPDHPGVSLVERIEGRASPARDHVFGMMRVLRVREGEWTPGSGGSWVSQETATFIRTREWRYVQWHDRGEARLFDIEADPYERVDLSADHPGLMADFEAVSAMYLEEIELPAEWMDGLGRLRDAQGRPAVGHRVWLHDLDGNGAMARWQTRTDARGYFRLPNVPADAYRLEWELEAAPASHRWHEDPPAGPTDTMAIRLQHYATAPFMDLRIEGPAADSPGWPIPRAQLTLDAESDGAPVVERDVVLTGWTFEGRIEERAVTGPDGLLTFDQLPPGLYLIEADVERSGRRGRADGPVQRITFLAPGEREEMRLLRRPWWFDLLGG